MRLGDGSASLGAPILTTSARVPRSFTARSTISGRPTTSGRHHSCIAGSCHAPAITSGPTPAGSPSVIATSGLGIINITSEAVESSSGNGPQIDVEHRFVQGTRRHVGLELDQLVPVHKQTFLTSVRGYRKTRSLQPLVKIVNVGLNVAQDLA
jgi:hypothetical protein